ncbi:hypothetical protein POTOM_019334 [Populus tomentosa]|uniref:non-specific serine/threonine protein kinase n=1 Tax=Populus tomentosa TaxID=118781 RepID=A0A8X8D2Z0_POPTO|nr:hypothetical protein POTOM_019334 [Populus tomentosa]
MDRSAMTVGPGMDMPIMHDSDRYDLVKDIGSGNFGVARLMRDKVTKELVAVKYIERGDKIDGNVQREIINHRSLRHPNIVRFKEVILTPTHLAIVMEYAAGGELFERICKSGRFSEDEARFFFQQLISGVSYCHAMQVCHRDLKLENTLLDDSPAPRLKICDFGYSKNVCIRSSLRIILLKWFFHVEYTILLKGCPLEADDVDLYNMDDNQFYSYSSVLHSQPKSTVGTPAYIAPEVLLRQEYDGKVFQFSMDLILFRLDDTCWNSFVASRFSLGAKHSVQVHVDIVKHIFKVADVWSCGVTLYVMLVGSYPFEDPAEPKDFRKTIQRVINVQYSIPDSILITPECRHLISRIFDADPATRITIPEIRNHEWFLKNLPADLMDEKTMGSQFEEPDQPMQSVDAIMQIVSEATVPAVGAHGLNRCMMDNLDMDDDMGDLDSESELDIDSSGEIVYAM